MPGSPKRIPQAVAISAHYATEFGNLNAKYGHVWGAVELFFQCVVQENHRQPRRIDSQDKTLVLLPSFHLDDGQPGIFDRFLLFREVEVLFSGPASRLQIERKPWVPSCHGPDEEAESKGTYTGPCCMNGSVARFAHRAGLPRPSLKQLEFRMHTPRVLRQLQMSQLPWEWRRKPDGTPAQSQRAFLHAMRHEVSAASSKDAAA